MSKTAQVKEKGDQMSPERMIAEIRSLRAGGLFIGNMKFIDALLAAYDQALVDLAASRIKVEELNRRLPGPVIGLE